MAQPKRHPKLWLFLLVISLFLFSVHAAECSKSKHCKTGCCSKDGFCGTTSAHCGSGCLSTCDYKPPKTECSKTNLCKTGCCSKDGFCGTSSAHCGSGCLSTCDYKPPPTECSKTRKCATGCCSQDGFCGTTEKHCGNGCQSTCDFKLGCDKSNPCKDGSCCSKFGFCGFGPDFCSKENCVTGCNAKTFCDPGGYGSQFANHTKCPLNVCCSKFGYCGLTEEFCGKKKVHRPSCSVSKSPLKRVVGYFEGWAPNRICDKFLPSQIPDGVYTHINFAFATIDPKTFEIAPAGKVDPFLYDQLAEKKRIDPNLKVFIAVGGWAFNDPGPTSTTFSDMAKSLTNQKKFISSIIRFMAKYDFDGVDIDWEYPEAPDRHGRGEDFKSLPQFLANLKAAMRQSGTKNGLSIAIPASYWYLQHFDIIKIAKHVDFFNLMTYDFHGSWDTPQSWLGNHLNSHTNLTEIKDSLDLLWRNHIDPDQVNLGLAFYARTFTASDPSCLAPGCLFDAGGNKGMCTNAVGVLSNSEIHERLLPRRSSDVTLDKKAAVKIVTSGRQWLTYDDRDTWKLKLDFARSQCLGGAMVWAISQDTRDGKYSKELQTVTGYKSNKVVPLEPFYDRVTGVNLVSAENEASTDVTQEQCRWTNCGKGCPSGWKGVTRQDKDRHSSTERMLDDTGCQGRGSRTFCCPPGKQPYCEWQRFKRGKCSPGCNKDDQYEVGSTRIGCHNHKAQVACCSGDTPALDAYRQCAWKGKEPNCATYREQDSCNWSASGELTQQLMGSMDGSGDQSCWKKVPAGTVIGKLPSMREYCCKESENDAAQWTGCGWYHKGLSSLATSRSGDCDASCPDGMIKLALQKQGCSSGKQAYCCNADVSVSSDFLDEHFEEALRAWVKNPTCHKSDDALSRRADSISGAASRVSYGEHPSRVRRDYALPSESIVQQSLTRIISNEPTSSLTKKLRMIWDAVAVPHWPHLDAETLAAPWQHDGYGMDSSAVIDKVSRGTMCHMDLWEKEMADDEDEDDEEEEGGNIHCPIQLLDLMDRELLENPDDEADEYDSGLGSSSPQDILGGYPPWFGTGMDKRAGGERDFKVECPGIRGKFSLFSEKYVNGENGDKLAKANNDPKKYYVANAGGNCFGSYVADDGKKDSDKWVSEHILELQTIARFVEFSMFGGSDPPNRSKDDTFSPKLGRITNTQTPNRRAPCKLWRDAFRDGFPEWNRMHAQTPMQYLFTQLGSILDSSDMVNCEAKLNSMKARVWSLYNPVGQDTWKSNFAKTDITSAEGAITELQLLQGVWQYLSNEAVKTKLLTVHNAVADFLEELEELYLKQNPTQLEMELGSIQWRDFMTLHFEQMQLASSVWAQARLEELTRDWKGHLLDLKMRRNNGAKVLTEINTAEKVLEALSEAQRNIQKYYKYDRRMFHES